jgi:hypothetical protein
VETPSITDLPPLSTDAHPHLPDDATVAANGLDAIPQQEPVAAQIPGPAPALDAPISLDQPMNTAFVPDLPYTNDMVEEIAPSPIAQRLSAFARLRFSDGSYYMHTYQIILGRNVELAHRDMRRIAKAEELRRQGENKRAEALLRGKKKTKTVQRPRSVISEAGGIVSAPMSAMPIDYQVRRQSVASHSISSSSHQHAASSQEEHVDQAPQDVIMQAFEELPDQLDSYVPEDPRDCPLVPIHPQHVTASKGVRGPKGISREHARIAYNFEKGAFEIEVLSTNGLYHEDTLYQLGEVVELNHGDTIVIGMVDMTFFLPDIALTEEQKAMAQGTPSRPMSFSFENGAGEVESDSFMDEDSASEEASVDPRHLFTMPVDYESEEDMVVEEEEEEDEEDDMSSPEPRYKPIKKQNLKQKLKIKLKNKARAEMPPPRKQYNNGHKRKPIREPTPEEPAPKRAKTKLKDVEREPPREKGKAPAKALPAKTPAKEPPPTKSEKKPESSKTPKSESPTLARKPIAEERGSGDEGEAEGTITAEMVKRHNLPEALIGMVMEKRKGPGRPPKDGVMSKRQRAQLVKQGKEIEKARAAGMDPADIPMPVTKPKVARPRKDSNANADGDEDIRETTEGGDGTASGDKKLAKPNRPPRTPSPEMRIEDYTEEQLQRPSANYVVLIHEAISSSKTGQMNLQQIYNYIEKQYPWYKFKTTTSGWQSSVRHNLGQHDAFVKGDKEGKGFNWRINPEVSIEKERRKRQVSPQISQAQRQGYYPPPPNGYPPYSQHPGPYYPGMPGASNGAPRPPPPSTETVQPRLPPSLARSAAAATPGAPTPSPYASPWAAGGNAAGSPPGPPRPFPPPNSQAPASSSAAPSGQYGVLFPTNAPSNYGSGYSSGGPYGGQSATASASPYGTGQPRPYTPYGSAGSPPNAPHGQHGPPQQSSGSNQSGPAHGHPEPRVPHPSGRYPLSTHPVLIHQLEAFRAVYLEKTTLSKQEEEAKVDRVLRAIVHPEQHINLSDHEKALGHVITNIDTIKNLGLNLGLREDKKDVVPVKQEESNDVKPNTNGESAASEAANAGPSAETPKTPTASTAAAIAASDAAVAASSQPAPVSSVAPPTSTSSQDTKPTPSDAPASSAAPSDVPHKFTPNMGGASASAVASPIRSQTNRPSVEPLTPVPGSPAVPNGSAPGSTLKHSVPDTSTEENVKAGAEEETPKEGEDAKPAPPPTSAP